ncbi:SDR family NAD(P)-dependent oxidoreductase [Terriglobus aquaticus]|uniref:SDR family NAD(P)-dependent oxidoreductase n=1 Tax=Terriglobus aquaticus TaxID=940139 RepID=A0ABW9KKT4_9BACT|nr:SDR family oxidoreductase [Terriglobus aquaticus]
MIFRAIQYGGNAVCRYGKYKLRKHAAESTLALGIVGAAVAVTSAMIAAHRRRAMLGKIVVITGGSRGLGLQLAEVFGKAGAHLVLASRNQDELNEAVGRLHQCGAIRNSGTALTVVCDVTKPEDCKRLIDQAIDRYGRVDVLINCAGIIDVAPFQDQPLEAFEQSMQINFFGALHTIQAVLPHMQQARSGSIVNIGSIGGKIGVPHLLPYVASKYALTGFTQGLRAELSGTGINVTLISPGLMRTGSHVNARFGGNSQAEYQWFALGATLPGASISATSAARKIYNATVDGTAEITITPQAKLAALINGVAPSFASNTAGLMNRALLPKPNGNTKTVPGGDLEQPTFGPLRKWSDSLQHKGNENPA